MQWSSWNHFIYWSIYWFWVKYEFIDTSDKPFFVVQSDSADFSSADIWLAASWAATVTQLPHRLAVYCWCFHETWGHSLAFRASVGLCSYSTRMNQSHGRTQNAALRSHWDVWSLSRNNTALIMNVSVEHLLLFFHLWQEIKKPKAFDWLVQMGPESLTEQVCSMFSPHLIFSKCESSALPWNWLYFSECFTVAHVPQLCLIFSLSVWTQQPQHLNQPPHTSVLTDLSVVFMLWPISWCDFR